MKPQLKKQTPPNELKLRLRNELIKCLSAEEDFDQVSEILAASAIRWIRRKMLFPNL